MRTTWLSLFRLISLTGVTDGPLLHGVVFDKDVIRTETLIYRSVSGTVRKIAGEHREMGKFKLD